MNNKIRWSLWGVLGGILALAVVQASEPTPSAPASAAAVPVAPVTAAVEKAAPAAAKTNAVDELVRSTSGGQGQRAPFKLESGPADEKVERPVSDDLENGLLLVQDKKYAEAIPLLEKSLKAMPTFEATWEALGWSYYYTGRAADADRLWQQYLTLRPDSAKAYSLLAQLSMLRHDWLAADRYLKGSLALEPKNYDIRYWYAQNLFRLGRLDPALEIFETLVREDDTRLDVKIDLARVYTLVQRYEASCDLWTEIVDALPDNLDFRAEYARSLMLVGSLEDADEQCRQILDDDHTRSDVMMIRADIAEFSQRPEATVEALLKLIDDADDAEVRAKLQARLAARLVLLNHKNPSRWPLTMALEQYAHATDAMPHNVAWLNQYAQVALLAHNTETARRVSDHILKDLNPNNYQALRTRFELEMLLRDYDAAERVLDDLHDAYQPDNPYRFLDLARLEIQRGHYAGAMDALDSLEEEGNRGVVLGLLYHGMTESEWMALTSTRRLREHLIALQKAGFTFITPLDVPEYLQKNARKIERPDIKPWLARQVDNVRYAFTGERQSVRKLEELRPTKVAVVTFDDGLRSSFRLGTPIAKELGITFGMFSITSVEELNAPMYASWEEMRGYKEGEAWQIGSHLLYASTDLPVGKETNVVARPLPNRVWLPERKRLETLREWTLRVRNEFSESRARLEKNLELPPGSPLAVAYPYSDIGQEEGSNVAFLLNPIRAILTEADRQYQVGFLVDALGYTCPSESVLMVRRYEPPWDANADDVVEHVMENHPVFIARRLRAEIATLMDKPYLAEKQIELLRRDGYPDRLLRQLITQIQNQTPAARALTADAADRAGTSRNRIRLSNPYVAGAYRENQSSREILQRMAELRGGLNLSGTMGLEVLYRTGSIDQTVSSNVWSKIRQSETTSSSETRTETTNGQTTVSTVDVQSTSTREVQTNRVQRTKYSADVSEIRGALSVGLAPTTSLLGTLGIKTLSPKQNDGQTIGAGQDEIVGSLAVSWQRARSLQLVAGYDRDIVPSARRKISYDGFLLRARWKVADDWDLTGDARYLSYEDQNAMVQLSGSSFWQIFERQGIWGGVEASTYSTDEKSAYYWSPYWDTRVAGVMRLRYSYQDYFFQFDVRLGQQQEKGRPEDVNAWRNLKAQAEADKNWDPGPSPNLDWDTFVGIGLNYRQRIWRHLDLVGDIYVNFLRDYSEHDYSLGLQYNF